MNTKLVCKIFLCAMIISAFTSAFAETINSSYVGPTEGNWSDPANWSPAIVPNNSATQKFDVSVGAEYPGLTLDIGVNIESLTLTEDFSAVSLVDHSLKSDATSLAVSFPDAGNAAASSYSPLCRTKFSRTLESLPIFPTPRLIRETSD